VEKRAVVLVAALLASIPASSQDVKNAATPESECAARFKAADKNSDGLITRTEILNAQQMPPPLAKESLVTRGEYIAACAKMPPAQAHQFDKPATPSPHSTGQTVSPETKGQQQPQGPTGPLETKSGGAPAESPQGRKHPAKTAG
jgi:hypothetical protein